MLVWDQTVWLGVSKIDRPILSSFMVHGSQTGLNLQLGYFCNLTECSWCGWSMLNDIPVPKTNILTRIPGILSVNVCSGHKKWAKRFKISRFQVLWEPQMIDYANFILRIKTMPNKLLTSFRFWIIFYHCVTQIKCHFLIARNHFLDARLGWGHSRVIKKVIWWRKIELNPWLMGPIKI